LEAMSRFNPQSLASSFSRLKNLKSINWAAVALLRRDLLGGIALGCRGGERHGHLIAACSMVTADTLQTYL
jgi:hypothetical protein